MSSTWVQVDIQDCKVFKFKFSSPRINFPGAFLFKSHSHPLNFKNSRCTLLSEIFFILNNNLKFLIFF
jgi:hypothetical protein